MNPILIGALLGLGKSVLIDKPAEDRQRELASQTALYSPFTGLKPDVPQATNPLAGASQGAALGALFNQGAGKENVAGSGDFANLQSTGGQTDIAGGVNADAELFKQLGIDPRLLRLGGNTALT